MKQVRRYALDYGAIVLIVTVGFYGLSKVVEYGGYLTRGRMSFSLIEHIPGFIMYGILIALGFAMRDYAKKLQEDNG